MPVKVDIHYSNTIQSERKLEETFTYCADFEKSLAGNFPGVEKIERVEDCVYRWLFEKFAYGGHELQIKLLTRFGIQKPNRIEMTPMPEAGSSQIQGWWKFDPDGDKTKVTFNADLQLELPIPFFLKAIAAPVAQKELSKLFDRYLSNVEKALA